MKRRSRRRYGWFGYGVWFVFGMLLGGGQLFVFHVALHTISLSMGQMVALMVVCGLIGGLWWGRRHRRQWERENAQAEMIEEIFKGPRE